MPQKNGAGESPNTIFDSGAIAYSALTNCPFSPHFSHFCGLQRPSFVNPQEHFQVAMLSPP
jgi:hypothetical protein